MLRMKGAEAPPQELPQVPTEPEAPVEAPVLPPVGGLQIDPVVAGYKGPELGPFMCQNCHFFEGDGECVILDGPVDPEGVCNLFTPIKADPEQEAPVEELPEEPLT